MQAHSQQAIAFKLADMATQIASATAAHGLIHQWLLPWRCGPVFNTPAPTQHQKPATGLSPYPLLPVPDFWAFGRIRAEDV